MSSLLELFTEQANSRQVDEQPGVEYEDVPYTFINPETNLPVEMTRRQPVQQRAPQPVDDLTDSTTLFDYGKSIMSGGAGVVSGIGWLMKQLGDEDWGEEGDYTTRFGKAIQDMGTNAVDYWNESLSDAAKTELAKEFVTKDENGEWQWGDASAATVGLFGAQSLLGTAAGMGAGAGITKTLQMFGNPIARGALVSTMQAGRATGATKAAIKAGEAAAKKLKMVDRVLGAAGFGAGEGTIGGIMTGVNVEEQVRNLPLEKLMQSPRFQEIYDSGDQLLSHEQRVEYARDTLAKESSSVAGFQAGTTTALLGAPMGAFFAPLFSRAGIKAINRGAATAIGAGGEAAQEFAQSGVEQLLTNKALIEAGDKRDLWDDVLNAAVGGAAAGGLMGGTFGFAGGADASARQQTKAKKKATANISHLQKITEEARDAGVDPEQVAPILDAAMKPGGMIPALRQMRQLIEEQQEEVPDLETAMEDVEAARPKPKAKRKRKTPKPEVPTLEVEKEEDEVTMPLAAEPQKAPEVETADDVAAQAHEAATSPENNLPEPTEAQKEYGNYKKGKVKLPHLPSILIENPDGSERKGKSADGTEWSRTMKGVHYGYFPRTEGADNEVDGTPTEGVDVMVNAAEGASKTDRPVFVIDQKNKDGSFDEHKVMVGFANGEAAVRAYKAQYDKDWDGIGAITPMGAEEFKAWLKDPENTTKPAAQPESTEAVPEPTPESVPQDQFTNYQDWINERSAEQLAEAPGVLQQIRIDERLEDGQSQQLEALWKEKTTPEQAEAVEPEPKTPAPTSKEPWTNTEVLYGTPTGTAGRREINVQIGETGRNGVKAGLQINRATSGQWKLDTRQAVSAKVSGSELLWFQELRFDKQGDVEDFLEEAAKHVVGMERAADQTKYSGRQDVPIFDPAFVEKYKPTQFSPEATAPKVKYTPGEMGFAPKSEMWHNTEGDFETNGHVLDIGPKVKEGYYTKKIKSRSQVNINQASVDRILEPFHKANKAQRTPVDTVTMQHGAPGTAKAQNVVRLEAGKKSVMLDRKYYQHFKNLYPNAEWIITKGGTNPVWVVDNGDLVGVAMPMRTTEAQDVAFKDWKKGPAKVKADEKKYPQPNKNGVYDKKQGTTTTFKGGKKKRNHVSDRDAQAHIHTIQVSDDEWLAVTGYEFWIGDFQGSGGPLSRSGAEVFTSQAEALAWGKEQLIKSMRGIVEGQGGTGRTDAQRQAARDILDELGYAPEPAPAPTTAAIPAVPEAYPGSDILAEQDFGGLIITETVEVEETGEQVEVQQTANAAFRRSSKRVTSLEKLQECVNA